MKLGNISINPEAFKDSTKEEFFAVVKGKLNIDKEEAWKLVCDYNKQQERKIKIEELVDPDLGDRVIDEIIEKAIDASFNKSRKPGKGSDRK